MAETQKEYRIRMHERGMKEVRGVYLPVEDMEEAKIMLRQWIKDNCNLHNRGTYD